jgi:hypothetical protein
MAWTRVESYSLGFGTPKKNFWLYYTLAGDPAAHQIFVTPTQFVALGDMFRGGGVINFNSDGSYFATDPRPL